MSQEQFRIKSLIYSDGVEVWAETGKYHNNEWAHTEAQTYARSLDLYPVYST